MLKFKNIEKDKFYNLLKEMRRIQKLFFNKFNIDDLWSNSKFTEVIIANNLNHKMIPGHSGSRDAKDNQDNIYEYKHYKKNSSNHSWTFNDYSKNTINKLKKIKSVIFAHFDDDNFPDAGTIFSKSELEWFKKNYFKVKSFDYKNHVENFGGAFKEFYNLGSHASYHLFKLK